jgi:hypothetical protein
METIEQVISTLKISEPIKHKNLSVSFLSRQEQQSITCLNWDEALILKALEVSEIDGGTVNEIRIVNGCIFPIFIPEGVVFVGLKQNRALRTSILINSRQELHCPCHCVEAGRWTSQTFYAEGSPYNLYSRLRTINLRYIGESLRNQERYKPDSSKSQQESWNNIRLMRQRKAQQTGRPIQSPAEDIADIYQDERQTLEDFITKLSCPQDAIGFIATMNGHVLTVELFGTTKLFNRNCKGILAGIALEATDREFCQELSHREPLTVEALLRSIRVAHKDHFTAIGQGVDIRLETNNMVGAALVHESQLYHLEVFTT